MTATATKLLERVRAAGGKYSVTESLGRGPKGGNRRAGSREVKALVELVAAGLVDVLAYESAVVVKRGNRVLYYTTTIQLKK